MKNSSKSSNSARESLFFLFESLTLAAEDARETGDVSDNECLILFLGAVEDVFSDETSAASISKKLSSLLLVLFDTGDFFVSLEEIFLPGDAGASFSRFTKASKSTNISKKVKKEIDNFYDLKTWYRDTLRKIRSLPF